jgi:hypothetical protein
MSTEPDLELVEGVEVHDVQVPREMTRQRKFKPAVRKHPAKRSTSPDRFQIDTIWEQVKERNSTGQYNFERFESMQSLNLCLMQHDLRKLTNEIFGALNDNQDVYPHDGPMREKIARLRPMLKEYSMSQNITVWR